MTSHSSSSTRSAAILVLCAWFALTVSSQAGAQPQVNSPQPASISLPRDITKSRTVQIVSPVLTTVGREPGVVLGDCYELKITEDDYDKGVARAKFLEIVGGAGKLRLGTRKGMNDEHQTNIAALRLQIAEAVLTLETTGGAEGSAKVTKDQNDNPMVSAILNVRHPQALSAKLAALSAQIEKEGKEVAAAAAAQGAAEPAPPATPTAPAPSEGNKYLETVLNQVLADNPELSLQSGGLGYMGGGGGTDTTVGLHWKISKRTTAWDGITDEKATTRTFGAIQTVSLPGQAGPVTAAHDRPLYWWVRVYKTADGTVQDVTVDLVANYELGTKQVPTACGPWGLYGGRGLSGKSWCLGMSWSRNPTGSWHVIGGGAYRSGSDVDRRVTPFLGITISVKSIFP